MPFIYKITNRQNLKTYVGATSDPAARWRNHRSLLNRGKHTCEFVLDWQEYGSDQFEFTIIEECLTIDDLIERETYWIVQLNAVKNGYNTIYGSSGNSGGSLSTRTRELMSSVRKGVTKSEEWKLRITEGLKKYHKQRNERTLISCL